MDEGRLSYDSPLSDFRCKFVTALPSRCQPVLRQPSR
jgi:hypothetical protein